MFAREVGLMVSLMDSRICKLLALLYRGSNLSEVFAGLNRFYLGQHLLAEDLKRGFPYIEMGNGVVQNCGYRSLGWGERLLIVIHQIQVLDGGARLRGRFYIRGGDLLRASIYSIDEIVREPRITYNEAARKRNGHLADQNQPND